MKPAARTRSIGTKVTEAEYTKLESCAFNKGLSISEWCRSVLLEQHLGDRPRDAEVTALAEILALRTILLNLHFAVAQEGTITADAMQAILDRADRNKARKAMERLGMSSDKPDGAT